MRLAGIVVILLGLVAFAAMAQTEKSWFDMENCGFCKEIVKQPGLMEHMHTDYQNISNGVVSVTNIDDGFWDEYEKAEVGMQKVSEGFQTGQVPPMCGHCMKMGEFFMKGVSMEGVKSAGQNCVVFIYQSPDSATVVELQAFGQKSLEEQAKMTKK